MTAEYTWYLKRDRFDAFLELAKHDCAACLSAGIPFVPICHVSPIQEGEADCGFALHRELLAFARQTAREAGKRLVERNAGGGRGTLGTDEAPGRLKINPWGAAHGSKDNVL